MVWLVEIGDITLECESEPYVIYDDGLSRTIVSVDKKDIALFSGKRKWKMYNLENLKER